MMERVGNKKANEYWEAMLPADYQRPASDDTSGMTKFIRQKYEMKKWVDPNSRAPNLPPDDGRPRRRRHRKVEQAPVEEEPGVYDPFAGENRGSGSGLADPFQARERPPSGDGFVPRRTEPAQKEGGLYDPFAGITAQREAPRQPPAEEYEARGIVPRRTGMEEEEPKRKKKKHGGHPERPLADYEQNPADEEYEFVIEEGRATKVKKQLKKMKDFLKGKIEGIFDKKKKEDKLEKKKKRARREGIPATEISAVVEDSLSPLGGNMFEDNYQAPAKPQRQMARSQSGGDAVRFEHPRQRHVATDEESLPKSEDDLGDLEKVVPPFDQINGSRKVADPFSDDTSGDLLGGFNEPKQATNVFDMLDANPDDQQGAVFGEQPKSNPFAEVGNEPTASNPFAQNSAPAANPFAQVTQGAQANSNPFAQTGPSSPQMDLLGATVSSNEGSPDLLGALEPEPSKGDDLLGEFDITPTQSKVPEATAPAKSASAGLLATESDGGTFDPFANMAPTQPNVSEATAPAKSASAGLLAAETDDGLFDPFASISPTQPAAGMPPKQPSGDPFAAPPQQSSTNPFGAPVQQSSGNPFAAPVQQSSGNPFAAPVQQSSGNPFAAAPPKQPSGSPFAAQPQVSSHPFGQDDNSTFDPFANIPQTNAVAANQGPAPQHSKPIQHHAGGRGRVEPAFNPFRGEKPEPKPAPKAENKPTFDPFVRSGSAGLEQPLGGAPVPKKSSSGQELLDFMDLSTPTSSNSKDPMSLSGSGDLFSMDTPTQSQPSDLFGGFSATPTAVRQPSQGLADPFTKNASGGGFAQPAKPANDIFGLLDSTPANTVPQNPSPAQHSSAHSVFGDMPQSRPMMQPAAMAPRGFAQNAPNPEPQSSARAAFSSGPQQPAKRDPFSGIDPF